MEEGLRQGCFFILWFSFYSMAGWLYETCLCSVTQKKLVNRGFLYGCYCPIYGTAAVIAIGFLQGIQSNISLFLWGMVVASVLEFITSWGLERLFHARWWDYSQRRFQLQGRVCLEGALVFGTMFLILVRWIHPLIERVTARIPLPFIYMATGAVLALLLTDSILTVVHLNAFNRKLKELHEKVEERFVLALETAEERRELQKVALAQRKQLTKEELALLREKLFAGETERIWNQVTKREKRLLKTFPKFHSNQHKEGVETLRRRLGKK